MELLVTLRDKEKIERLVNICDGFIVGSLFTSGYNLSKNDLIDINESCKYYGIKLYIVLDNFISEDEKKDVIDYLAFISKMDISGIFVHDLGLYEIAKIYNLDKLLIYDGQTIICNSLDVSYYISKGFSSVVLSRELTYDELINIVIGNPGCCDIQIFGHTRLSYSKRKFVSNYFKELNMFYDMSNINNLSLVEEKREYRMPILEDSSGTKIYSDYIFQMFNEFITLKPFINRAIVDSMFIDINTIVFALDSYKYINHNNINLILDRMKNDYPNNYSTGFLYQKTNITKDE